MDRFTRRQRQIERRAAKVMAAYPSLWEQMIKEWRQPGSDDRAWLLYSANYLFRTAGVRWAMDPIRLRHRLPGAPEMPVADLKNLSFVILTHQHGDHLDLDLLRQLQAYPIYWVVPAPVLEVVEAEFKLPMDRVIVPRVMQPIEIYGMRITPFEGLHWEKQAGIDELRGVPAMGYLVEFNGRRWLFPGDTRSYDASRLPFLGPVDGVFAHLWLGRAGALLEPPPLLDEFCKFFLALQTKRIIVTHLEEFGRDASDYWDKKHARQVEAWYQKYAPDIQIDLACLVDCTPI
jgi:L-ascorbate metabolism protein UlaG (beta-lactamase superfamily)